MGSPFLIPEKVKTPTGLPLLLVSKTIREGVGGGKRKEERGKRKEEGGRRKEE
jgi:hypothetical protein